MASPKLEPLALTDAERHVLRELARGGEPVRALRSRIVLACAGGAPVGAVATELGISRTTAAKWRSRFLHDRLAGLSDEPRPGRPRTITDEQVAGVLAATQQQPPPGGDPHWSTRSMARQSGLSQTAISRIWRAFGLSPGTGNANAAYRELINDSGHDVDAPPGAAGGVPYGPPVRRKSAMLTAERRDLLLARLRRDGKLIARDLARELGLSEDSVRRDLRELAAAGLCQRVYGGALPISPALGPQASRSEIAPDSKRRVAAAAAALITPRTTVILDGGTTALEVAAALAPDLDATIVTPSATTAAALASHPRVRIFMLGGQLHKQAVSASGAAAVEQASGITADLALLIIPGIHPVQGLTHADSETAALTRILIRRTADTYVMASIEKLGTVCAYKVAGLSELAGIITDAPPGHPAVQQLRDQGVAIIQAA
jgi:DeoR/GlpR family transcriptional regulator of sugar metabolism/transposase